MDNLTGLQQAMVEHDEDMARLDRNTRSYKGPINRPCSPCSAGDTKMEYHDHDYVKLENRIPPQRCIHCDPTFKPTGPDGWCECVCHNTGEF